MSDTFRTTVHCTLVLVAPVLVGVIVGGGLQALGVPDVAAVVGAVIAGIFSSAFAFARALENV